MSWPPETLQTARLRLRKPLATDAEAVFGQLSGDAGVTRHLGWLTHHELAQSRQQISLDLLRWSRGSAWTWIVELDAHPVGMFRYSLVEPHMLRIGAMLARPHHGQGFMSEVTRRMIDEAFRVPAFHRIEALCDADNQPSRRMLERSGLRCEGRLASCIIHPNLSSLPRDAWLYAISRQQAQDAGLILPHRTPLEPPAP